MPGTLEVLDFFLVRNEKLIARVAWDPANPGSSAGAEMKGRGPNGEDWIEINGGIAFLNVIRGEGASLRLEAWGTDTNGDYTAKAIDIFTLPIDITRAFPASFVGLKVASLHIPNWYYKLSAIPGNPNGFLLDAP